ncbi:MAG: hypothetical protein ACE5Q6_16850 [Dehalococcoidia bacterium]
MTQQRYNGSIPSLQRQAPGRIRTAPSTIGAFPPTAEEELPPGAEPAAPPEPPAIPRTFDELLFNVIMVNRARETSVVVEQTVAAGASGSTTVSVPANEVDVSRFFVESGDGSISYSIDVQAAGQTAVASHRITGGTREFARYWEKTTQIIIDFVNNDLVNPALLQISWTAVRLETSKWTAYRDGLISLIELLGIEP